MKITLKILLLVLCSAYSFSQVDVIYNDLVWSDEFNSNGAISSANWHHQTQIPPGGNWYNGEQQHYTNQLTNASVSNGVLRITAKKETFTDQGYTKQYTSARLNSKFAFLYGRVDIRAKIPTSQGTWPALWMLGKNIIEPGGFFSSTHGTTSWPACGEIDIMEHGITPSQPTGYIQSAIHTPSSFGNTINHGGIIASNLGNEFHVYSMNWSPNQITFLLDGVAFYTYNPAIKTPSNWPFNAEQYLLLNIAMGGVAGSIPSNFTQATMEIDYVRVYQNTTVDTQAPTNFTASIGTITGSTIELLVQANDNVSNIEYTVSYNGTSITSIGQSGVQKSVIISGLNPNTNYSFSITVSDASGNNAINNPIVLSASTIGQFLCTGTDIESQQGSFTVGYNYTFETIGTNVKFTFEMLDTDKVGVVAYLWRQNPFTEYPMTNVSGTKFTHTITNQTIGQTLIYACKFAFAGGLAVTKYFPYVVGSNCTLEQTNFTLNDNDFKILNPVKENLIVASKNKIDKIEIYNLSGSLVFQNDSITNSVNISELSKGVYLLVVYTDNQRILDKIIKTD